MKVILCVRTALFRYLHNLRFCATHPFLEYHRLAIMGGHLQRFKTNPIIPGFAPDPSLVFVDGTYFLVNSTFHMFPGLPVYASTDLSQWTHIGKSFL